MENPQKRWWDLLIGRSSSIDTLEEQPVTLLKLKGDSDKNIKSLDLSKIKEHITEEKTEEIPQYVLNDFLKNVQFTEKHAHKNPRQYAEEFVSSVIIESRDILNNYNYSINISFQASPNVKWPTQEEFNIFKGLSIVDEYIGTWTLHPDWKHFIELKKINTGPFGTEYVYEVKFSCPRPQFPVPQATASVYFFMVVNPSKPWNSEIEVYFMVESMESKFYPGDVTFNQKWLELVVDTKINFFKQIRR